MSPGEVVSTVTGTSAYIRRRLQADIKIVYGDWGVKERSRHGFVEGCRKSDSDFFGLERSLNRQHIGKGESEILNR